jgi:hypothetical protein
MDVPRIRYEIGTRRVGASPPIADAGPNQNVQPGTVTLNGSGSSDPLGLPLTYQWLQIAGPTVTINNATGAIATFTGVAGSNYSFRLTVKNTDNLSASATTSVSVVAPTAPVIVLFSATPAAILPGQSSTLTWSVQLHVGHHQSDFGRGSRFRLQLGEPHGNHHLHIASHRSWRHGSSHRHGPGGYGSSG